VETYYTHSVRETGAESPLTAPAKVRVAIVGGGYAGLATALGLAERGIPEVLLAEAHTVGYGASGRNGGFVFAGFSLGEAALLRAVGADDARALYASTRAAMRSIRQRIDTHRIDCDPVDGGVLWANWFDDATILRRRQSLLESQFDVHWPSIAPSDLREQLRTERYRGALFEPDAFHVHPLNLARGLKRAAESLGVRVCERTPIARIERRPGGWRLHAGAQHIDADTVVICGGGYLGRWMQRLNRALLPIATYVMATEPLGDRLASAMRTAAAVYDTRFAFDYYRALPDTRILWGGRISIFDRAPSAVARLLKADLLRVYPQLAGVRVDFAWSGLMSYARHEMPQLGELEPGLWYAQAFGGHGVATTTAAGETIAAAIATGDDAYRRYRPFGLASTYRPFGYLAAQANYWWLQWRDALRQ
jgi:gamma-glutamylputrescine oxidase